jgi:tripartite-type tricarboxylate transporter receptor subunit TctC
MKRRLIIQATAGAATSLALPLHAQKTVATGGAAPWPTDTVRLVVPFAAGGGTDRLARLMGQRLAERTGKSFVVENKPGAGGNIGATQVVKANDPNQLLFTTAAIAISPFLFNRPGYDLNKDLTPVVQVSSSPLVLVVKNESALSSLADLPKAAAGKAGGLNYASPGVGTSSHLGGFLLAKQLGMPASHVAYRGAGPAATALMSGEVDFALMAAVAVLPFIRNKQLRALAVAGKRPLADLATAPLLGGPPNNLDLDNWQGIFMPTKLGPAVATAINNAVNETLKLQDVRTAIYADGATPVGGSGALFKSVLVADGARYGSLVLSAGIKPE